MSADGSPSVAGELFVHEAGTCGAPTTVFLHGGGLSGRMSQPQAADLVRAWCTDRCRSRCSRCSHRRAHQRVPL